MTLYTKIRVFIEIEKHTNVKYEYCKEAKKLVVDRILPYPYFYPYAYGFIPNTLAPDNDEMDILVITDRKLNRGAYYDAYIIGVLLMEDEKGEDNKILCVLEEDVERIKDIHDLDDDVKNGIVWFFSNYKSTTPGKWSHVNGIGNKKIANKIYEDSITHLENSNVDISNEIVSQIQINKNVLNTSSYTTIDYIV